MLRFARQFVFWFCDCCVLQGNSSFNLWLLHFYRAIHLLICNCWISHGNSSFDLRLLCFARQFVFLFCICCVSQGNSSSDLRLLHFTGQFVFWWHDHCELLDDQCICFAIAACCWAIIFRWHDRCVSLDDQYIFWERNPRITSFFGREISRSCIHGLLPEGDLYSVMKYKKRMIENRKSRKNKKTLTSCIFLGVQHFMKKTNLSHPCLLGDKFLLVCGFSWFL